MDCVTVRAESIAERYLRSELAEAEQQAFEEHLVACAICADELAGLCALSVELQRSRLQIVAEAAIRPSAWRRRWVLALAAVVVVASGLGIWMRFQPAPALRPELAALAAIEPPSYAPVRLRGNDNEAARRFREAMELYAAGDWRGALPGLRSAAGLDPEAPHLAFYLGACALLAGETNEGISELERTAALGDTPFLEEAGFYLAKARLQEGNVDAARREFVKVIALDGDRRAEAQDLLDRLDALEGRQPSGLPVRTTMIARLSGPARPDTLRSSPARECGHDAHTTTDAAHITREAALEPRSHAVANTLIAGDRSRILGIDHISGERDDTGHWVSGLMIFGSDSEDLHFVTSSSLVRGAATADRKG
jgi:tetratricopeptide (TPR) repeat protein